MEKFQLGFKTKKYVITSVWYQKSLSHTRMLI